MLKLEHIIQGYNVDPEYVQVVFSPGCVKTLENQFEFAEEHILDALYYHGHIALMAVRDNKDSRFCILDLKSNFYACCTISEHKRGDGFFVKVYFIGKGHIPKALQPKYTIWL